MSAEVAAETTGSEEGVDPGEQVSESKSETTYQESPFAEDVVIRGEGTINGAKKWLVFKKGSLFGTCRLTYYKSEKESNSEPHKEKVAFSMRVIDDVVIDGDIIKVTPTKGSATKIRVKNPQDWYSAIKCHCDDDVEYDADSQVTANLLPNPQSDVEGSVQIQVDDDALTCWQGQDKVLVFPLSRILVFGHLSDEVFHLETDECCLSDFGTFHFEMERPVKPWSDLHEIYKDWDTHQFDPRSFSIKSAAQSSSEESSSGSEDSEESDDSGSTESS